MIRINLLTVERAPGKRKSLLPAGQQILIGCGLVLLLGAAFIGWRYWSVTRDSAQLDADIANATAETARLKTIIQQVQRFEEQRGELQQRVTLIEQLRNGQTGPVHMLDQVSRALPPMLWLVELKQTGEDITVEGRCTQLTALSDFVANLEASGYFQKSIEILSTSADAMPNNAGELIKFSIKAHFQRPGDAPAPGAAAPRPGVPAVASASNRANE